MIEVRRATERDLAPLSSTLARAFAHDPVMTWLVASPDASRRPAADGGAGPLGPRSRPWAGPLAGDHLRRLRWFLGAQVRHYHRHAEVLTAPRREGAALWAPPGRWRMRWGEVLRGAPAMVAALRARLPRGLRALGLIERAHPRQPHWYLAVLGTDPTVRGRGVGAALVQPPLERCDRDGLGAYLESSNGQNIPYYERFGFRVTGEIALPGGPTVWPMWRDPR